MGKVLEKGEIINMAVKEIFKHIMLNDNVEIIDQKNYCVEEKEVNMKLCTLNI